MSFSSAVARVGPTVGGTKRQLQFKSIVASVVVKI